MNMLLLLCVLSISVNAATEATTLKVMEKVFARSEKVHTMSMAAITRSMTESKAWHVLEKNNLTTPALIQMTSNLHGKGKKSSLRKSSMVQPEGYAGIDGARKMLNDMIYKAMEKYDAEIAKCTEYYSEQCAAMEACRGQISQSNYVAANSRKLILDAQTQINLCEVSIPNLKWELQKHNLKCKNELARMKARLAVIEADIAVMTTILQMTDCKTSSFAQMKKLALLRCKDPCSKKTFVTFNHDHLKQKVSQLQSSSARKLMTDTFADLFKGISELQATEFLQLATHQDPAAVNLTNFSNPPIPRTEIPADPCTDKDSGAPSVEDKRNAKCTITKSPQCYKLQERFLLIQSGIQDERDALLEDIASMKQHCKEVSDTLQAKIANDEALFEESQTKLAFATEKEATAGEQARQTAAQNSQLDGDLKKQMKTCSTNYINYETELCALKKIRGELYKMQGSGHSSFFQDCEVSKWEPEECSTECKATNEADGEQKLTRNVMTHPDGGAACLPLEALKKCNLQPCPVDCKLEAWTGWSKCSAECGGGVQQRLREVTRASAYGGKPCGSVSETRQCNSQACESDCKLSEWSKWSWCSKDCDGGTRKRQKHIVKGVEGAGSCPNKWDPKRLQYKECNKIRCPMLKCKEELDVVFLLDGSGSLGETGWKAEIKAAQTFVDAFSEGAKANMAVILFSGPRTWSGVYKCWSKNSAAVNMETDCKIKTITHFTTDMAAVKTAIAGLTWPSGSTLTSLALMRAKAELQLGRKDAKSVVVVITDGRPLSYGRTWSASHALRKAARLVWVPVTAYAPLWSIKRWATRRWKENVVKVNTFAQLEDPATVNHIIADICPTHDPNLHNSLWAYTGAR